MKTPKKNKSSPTAIYLSERHQYLISIGDWRFQGTEKGEERCYQICEKCRSYYEIDDVSKNMK